MYKILFNKYTITILFFVVWLLFFDKNDFFTQRDLSIQLKKLYDEKRYYLNEIEKNKIAADELKNNMQSLERFARERYWMKKDIEEVYIIVNKK
jgi:cell division protein FtsB